MYGFDYTVLILFAIAIIILFFVLRNSMLWYYRIDDRIMLMEQNNELLKELVKHFTGKDYSELLREKKGLFINKSIGEKFDNVKKTEE